MKTNSECVFFLPETENQLIHKTTPQQIHSPWKVAPMNLNENLKVCFCNDSCSSKIGIFPLARIPLPRPRDRNDGIIYRARTSHQAVLCLRPRRHVYVVAGSDATHSSPPTSAQRTCCHAGNMSDVHRFEFFVCMIQWINYVLHVNLMIVYQERVFKIFIFFKIWKLTSFT